MQSGTLRFSSKAVLPQSVPYRVRRYSILAVDPVR